MNSEPLLKATSGLKTILDEANALLATEDGTKLLTEKPGSIFCPAIKIYSNLLKEYSLSNFKDLDKNLKRNPKLENAAEEFWDIEALWDENLTKIDSKISNGGDGNNDVVKKIGEQAPIDASLIDVRNRQKSCLLENVLDENQGFKVHLVLLRHLS